MNSVPVDDKIVKRMTKYGMDEELINRHVRMNKHNHVTTTYYLMLKRYIAEGGCSNADIGSAKFKLLQALRPKMTMKQL